MTLVEKLRAGRDAYVVKYCDYIRIVAARPQAVVMFFEGKDAKYYSSRIDAACPGMAWESIACGGKDALLKLFRLVTDQHQHARSYYFVDRDFDSDEVLPCDPRVYVTPVYSIENLYVTESAFARILKYEFDLEEHSEEDESFARCRDAFALSLDAFCESVAVLNGWVIVGRQKGVRLNLKSLNLSDLIQIDLNRVAATYSVDDLNRTYGAECAIDTVEAVRAAAAIPVNDRVHRFRGKFQVYFLRKYVALMIQDASSVSPVLFSSKRRVSLHVSDVNIVSELAQYADTPPCLLGFLSGIAGAQALL